MLSIWTALRDEQEEFRNQTYLKLTLSVTNITTNGAGRAKMPYLLFTVVTHARLLELVKTKLVTDSFGLLYLKFWKKSDECVENTMSIFTINPFPNKP